MSREYRGLSGSCLTQWRMGSSRDQALQVMQASAIYPTPEPCMSAQAGLLSRDRRPAIAHCLMTSISLNLLLAPIPRVHLQRSSSRTLPPATMPQYAHASMLSTSQFSRPDTRVTHRVHRRLNSASSRLALSAPVH